MLGVQGAPGEGAPISWRGEGVAGVRWEVGGRRSTWSAETINRVTLTGAD